MEGATEYYHLFNGQSEQIGRLYFECTTHARGECFKIYVLPPNVNINSSIYDYDIENVVEVYGVISGQLGWTEVYGWLHDGKWQEDFEKIIIEKKATKESVQKEMAKEFNKRSKERKDKIKILLENY